MLVGGGNTVQGWRVVWKKITALNSSNVSAARCRTGGKVAEYDRLFWCASDQELLAEEHIDQVDLFIASPTMTRPISCPPCLPNVWVEKGDGIDPTSRLCGSGSGERIDIAISPQQATISALLSHVQKQILLVFPHYAAA